MFGLPQELLPSTAVLDSDLKPLATSKKIYSLLLLIQIARGINAMSFRKDRTTGKPL